MSDDPMVRVLREHTAEWRGDAVLGRVAWVCTCDNLSADDYDTYRAHLADALRAAGYIHRDEVTPPNHACDERCDHLGEWLDGGAQDARDRPGAPVGVEVDPEPTGDTEGAQNGGYCATDATTQCGLADECPTFHCREDRP